MTIRNLPAGIAPSAYLESLRQNDRFKDCREFYTSTQAQIPLQVQALKQEEQKKESPEEEKKLKREPPVEVLAGLRKSVQEARQVLLIGKPGSGKTTALRQLVWQGVSAWAHGAVNEQDLPIPVFVELRGRDGKSAKAVLEWIQDALEMHDQDISPDEIKQLLKQDQLLLLFDGVNEASSESVSALDTFRERYPKTPMIFTTRELGAGQVLGIEKKLEMVPLSLEEMRSFIDKRLRGESEKLINAMGDRLRELAETPMLLNMFCEVYKPEQPIPQNRGELFRQFARLYDEKHKRRCQYEGIVYPDFYDFRDEVLQHLAFEMLQGQEKLEGLPLQIKRTDAEKLIERVFHQRGVADAPTKVKKWLDGLVRFHLLQVASHPNRIEFHHPLFQEYYAAEALLPKLSKLTNDQLKCHYLNYLKWTEPLAIALALIDKTRQALQIMQLVLDTDLMLGARLIYSLGKGYSLICRGLLETFRISEVLEQIEQLTFLFDNSKFLHQESANWNDDKCIEEESLFVNYETDFPRLLEGLCHRDEGVRINSAKGLSRLAKKQIPEAITALSTALEDPVYEIRNIAVKTLGKLKFRANL
ncbi:MAG: hypothetical protein Fur0046_38480 [Cyanobacteria bacterium J069]|nr:MAG: NACHT domain-containing protein [Cyanobacteria bacterium J069]